MNYLFFYFLTVLIWGSTWLAIHFQVGIVSPLWSVVYRFALATVALWLYCLFTRRSLKFNATQHKMIALQGFLLFSLNYTLYYFASIYLNSGILAVVFATILLMNIFNSRMLFKTPLELPLCIGAFIGLLGLIVVFWAELHKTILLGKDITELTIGLLLAIAATYFASLGNMASTSILRTHNLPVVETNTLGMAYGTGYTLTAALLLGGAPSFDFSWLYIGSLIYLGIFGSIIAFGAYLSLLNKIGPERAAYTFILTPLVALGLSTLFEDFDWHIGTLLGLSCVLLGNVLVLKRL